MIWRVTCKIYPDFYRVHSDFSRLLTWFFSDLQVWNPAFFKLPPWKKTGQKLPPKKFRQQARKFRARLHPRKFHFSRKEGQQIKRASMYKLGEIWCLQSDFLEESEQFFLPMKINWKTNACKLSYLKLTNTTINLEAHWINHKLRRRKIGKKSKVWLEISDADISP